MVYLWLLAFFLAQDKPPEKRSISGRVVPSITGRPLGKVDLSLLDRRHASHTAITTTDSEGQFRMIGLEPASYHLPAANAADTSRSITVRGRADGDGSVLRPETRQSLENLTFRLKPASVIAGTIRDNYGEPIERNPFVAHPVCGRSGRESSVGGQHRARRDQTASRGGGTGGECWRRWPSRTRVITGWQRLT